MELLFCCGMAKAQEGGVKGLASDEIGVTAAVEAVAGNGMADVGQVDADLMGAARLQAKPQKGVARRRVRAAGARRREALQQAVMGQGRGTVLAHPPLLFAGQGRGDGKIDDPLGGIGDAVDQGRVFLDHLAAVRLADVVVLGIGVLGHHQ